MKIKILTDTSCGIPSDEAKSLGYEMLALPFMLDEKEYDDNTITKSEFYEKLRKSSDIHTSQAPVSVVTKAFDELLKDNDHILYFPITSGLSSSYQTGLSIAEDIKYKGKVTVVDHRTISVLMRAMLSDVTRLIDKRYDPQKIKEIVEKNNRNNCIYIAVDSLEYLKKGGRVSPLVAAVGNILSIKPILFSDGGKFDVVKKVRSVKLAEDSIRDFLVSDLKEKLNLDTYDNVSVGIAFTECTDEGKNFEANLASSFNVKVTIDELPLVVGCHVGPGVVAAALYKRINEC